MKIIRSIQDWRDERQGILADTRLGFVATMGHLHAGHAALVQRSLEENDITVVSIFVNPTQFNSQEDFTTYPVTLEQDVCLLDSLQVDYLLLPSSEEIYQGEDYRISKLTDEPMMEDLYRPNHFSGVLTVVMKLFMLVKPSVAYFGEKDYQQYQMIKQMSEAFFLDVKVMACQTVRQENGVALSSRNSRLSSDELQRLARFPTILQSANSSLSAQKSLVDSGFKVDYVVDWQQRRFGAVWLGEVRLIDNISLMNDKENNLC